MDSNVFVMDHPLIQHKLTHPAGQKHRLQRVPGAGQRNRDADVL